jgi:hypothetical protein
MRQEQVVKLDWIDSQAVLTHAFRTCSSSMVCGFWVLIPDSVGSALEGSEPTQPTGYAFFAERSEGRALGFNKASL